MAYARKAVLNEFLRAVRKRSDVVYEAGVVEDFAAATVNRDHLLSALRKLPARQRAAVVLRFLYDMPEAQVAQELGCSVGNVKSQTSRGLAKIRELWSNGHEVARRQA